MSIKHSKFKNTGLLFELLVRQITSDTLEGKNSTAINILKKYFVNTELGKEYRLYEQVTSYKNLTEAKADMIINTLIEASTKLKRSEIRKQKYNLVREIKKFEIFLKKKMILFEVDFHPSKVIDFINFFNKKKYGINYDTGNSASLGYKINDEIKYFNYVKNIHIKDRIFNGASVRLGEGNFNFKLLIKLDEKNIWNSKFSAKINSHNHNKFNFINFFLRSHSVVFYSTFTSASFKHQNYILQYKFFFI